MWLVHAVHIIRCNAFISSQSDMDHNVTTPNQLSERATKLMYFHHPRHRYPHRKLLLMSEWWKMQKVVTRITMTIRGYHHRRIL